MYKHLALIIRLVLTALPSRALPACRLVGGGLGNRVDPGFISSVIQ